MNDLDKLFKNSDIIEINDNSKIVIMSDLHRGSGNNYDNFLHNKNIYNSALRNYFIKGFTYIELGDGDELWEVQKYQDIIREHLSSFKLLKKFNENDRLIMLYGNHDIEKRNKKTRELFEEYDNEELLGSLQVKESIILRYKDYDLFLLHGHQVDTLNSKMWKLSRFLVRHIWKNLEKLGFKDPTSAAKNYSVSKFVDKKLEIWSKNKNKIIIAGHTHKPVYPEVGKSLYFNDGAGVHPDGVSAIEIENGKITLVKWSYKSKSNDLITVGREIIMGGYKLDEFFKD